MRHVDQREVSVNGLDITYLVCGTGPLALCLHGFPDTAATWRHLFDPLANQGYTVVAPWLRGYAPSGIAPDGSYQTAALAADALALHDQLGGDGDAVIIGHDWGAMTAYGAAVAEPQRWRRVVTLAVPPMPALATSFFNYEQIRRSFYMFFFQSPLAEIAVAMNELEFIAKLWRDWSPGFDAARSGDLDNVGRALGDPANLSAAIGYYRAMFDPTRQRPELAGLQESCAQIPPQPTLYLHGADDGCLGASLTHGVDALLSPGSQVELVADAGHFLQLEQPAIVNQHIIDFLTA